MPPYQPPPGAAPGGPGMPPPPKKKKWPWILAGLFVFCFLPLGACGALIGFGVNAIGNIQDDLTNRVETMFLDASNGEYVAGASFAEASGGCVSFDELAAQLEEIAPDGPASVAAADFVERGENSYLSNMGAEADESFFVDGRTGASAARVRGTVPTVNGTRDFEVLLVDDGSGWGVCSVSMS